MAVMSAIMIVMIMMLGYLANAINQATKAPLKSACHDGNELSRGCGIRGAMPFTTSWGLILHFPTQKLMIV